MTFAWDIAYVQLPLILRVLLRNVFPNGTILREANWLSLAPSHTLLPPLGHRNTLFFPQALFPTRGEKDRSDPSHEEVFVDGTRGFFIVPSSREDSSGSTSAGFLFFRPFGCVLGPSPRTQHLDFFFFLPPSPFDVLGKLLSTQVSGHERAGGG